MPKVSKKKDNAEEVAEELSNIVWEHLKTLPEKEQERRLSAAEDRLTKASRAGSRRTSSLTRRTGRSPASRQGR
jgi:hypothetical protein